MFNLLLSILEEDYDSVLRILLSTSAIAVPIFLGFVVQQFSILRREQLSRLRSLGSMQDKLRLYRDAIYGLSSDLLERARSGGIEIDFTKDYLEVIKSPEFWKKEHAYAIAFMRAMRRFGEEFYKQGEIEKGGEFFTYEEMESLYRALQEVSGTLAREKHYKHVFRSLGIDYENKNPYLIEIPIDRAKFHLPLQLYPQEDDRITRLSFWEELIEDALELMEKMRPIYQFLLYRFPKRLLSIPFF